MDTSLHTTSFHESCLTNNQTSYSISKAKKPFPQLLYKDFDIFYQNFTYPVITRSTTTKSFTYDLKYNTIASPRQKFKVAQILRNQTSLSKLKLTIDSNKPFETTLFFSQIKHLHSLDTLELNFDHKLACLKKGLYLPHLKKLTNLSFTFWTSEFPHPQFFQHLFRSIKPLKNLSNLSLRFQSPMNLTDSCLDLLTFHLCKLTQLRSLALIFSDPKQLTNRSIHSLALALPKLSSLNKIEIRLIEFSLSSSLVATSSTILQFFSSFNQLKNLTDITLGFAKIKIQSNGKTDPFSEGLLYLEPSRIKRLNLSPYKDSDARALVSLTQALSCFNSLCTLDLSLYSSNRLTAESIHQSLLQLKNIPSLSSLNIYFESLKLPSSLVINVATALKTLTSLKKLKLDFEDLSQTKDEEIIELSTSLTGLTSLWCLDISLRKAKFVTDKSLESLALSLKGLTLLEYFSLNIVYAESIGNQGIEALAGAVSSFKILKTFSLGLQENSYIDKKGMDKLAVALESLPELSKVSLNLRQCKGLNTPSQALKVLLKVVKKAKNIQEIDMILPHRKYIIDEVKQIQKRKITKFTIWM